MAGNNNAYGKNNPYGTKQGQGYEHVPKGGLPQYSEAWALIEASRRMAVSINAEDSVKAMREALRLNWKLWTIFQAELSEDTGVVPTDVRSDMLQLCHFVDKHTVDALHKPTEAKVTVLVEMNRNIAAGLLEGLNNSMKDAEGTQDALNADLSGGGLAPSPSNEEPQAAPAPLPSSFDENI